jgi:hypothetical protein
MGTNYYARIIPKQEDKQKLIDAINNNQFDIVQRESKRLFGDKDQYENIGGIIHLGKRSGGWKFLWNANVYEYIDGRINEDGPWDKTNFKYRHEFIYPLTKQGISDFLHRDDVIIISEYYDDELDDNVNRMGEDLLTADEFLKMAFEWGQKDGWDSNGYKQYQIDNGKVYYDWSDNERNQIWEDLGYKVNNGCDFYSDGLRFSTSIDFS